MNIPAQIQPHLTTKASDFIIDGKWSVPASLLDKFSIINDVLKAVCIPFDSGEDILRWKLTSLGDLPFKQAYQFQAPVSQSVEWTKFIWSRIIPPFKSILVWRLIRNRITTDDN